MSVRHPASRERRTLEMQNLGQFTHHASITFNHSFTVFGLDSPLGLFPPGMDPGKIYSPLMEMSDPRSMHHDGPPFLKKKSVVWCGVPCELPSIMIRMVEHHLIDRQLLRCTMCVSPHVNN
uniref:Uncharacterized protein n=1 Tax=Anopheles maculatus TaxID=74869 RepID=A0A182SIF8_9DIPT